MELNIQNKCHLLKDDKCSLLKENKENNKKEEKMKGFIVEIDDMCGNYLESLLNVIEKYTSRKIDIKNASKIETDDYLIFTKDEIYIKFNHRTLPNLKVYSLVYDYYKIVDLIKGFHKKSEKLPYEECKKCPYYNTARKMNKILFDGEFVGLDEKVSIFNNFVKIGYDTYSIYNHHGKSVVDIDDVIYEVIVNDIFVKSPKKKESICSKFRKCLECLK